MRRIGAAALLMTLLGSTWQATASEPHPRMDEEAVASWILPTGKAHRFKWLAIIGHAKQRTGDERRGFVVPVTGRCDRHNEDLMCLGVGGVTPLRKATFESAPDLSTGTIAFRQRGEGYRAHLVGDGIGPAAVTRSEECGYPGPQGAGEGAGLLREATATGAFAGRKMVRKDSKIGFSFLFRGAMLTECEGTRLTIVSRSDGQIRYRLEVEGAFSAR